MNKVWTKPEYLGEGFQITDDMTVSDIEKLLPGFEVEEIDEGSNYAFLVRMIDPYRWSFAVKRTNWFVWIDGNLELLSEETFNMLYKTTNEG